MVVLAGCVEREAPPGAEPPAQTAVLVAAALDGGALAASGRGPQRQVPPAVGTVEDNLPFSPTGDKIASIAWRTWVYTDTGPKRTRYGYLRAGAIVDRRGPELKNEGCAGGWWRVNPRGFVCVGKGATLDVNHPVVVASTLPERGKGLPYGYALARDAPPHLYFRAPTVEEMQRVEGRGFSQKAALWRSQAKGAGAFELLGEPGDPPGFLLRGPLEKPYGVEQRLHYSVHSGQASADSGFALGRIFNWQGRVFGLSTELDFIALDRTRLVVPSSFRGVELGVGEDLPVAFVKQRWTVRYERAESGQLEARGTFEYRQGLKLVGPKLSHDGVSFWQTSDGSFIAASSALVIVPRDSFPSVASGGRKWVDVSIRNQTLVAYEGKKAVYATLVSTGRGGLTDPDKGPATVRGTFMVHTKHISSTMDGEEDEVSDSFALRDVPFVQYFHKGYALHGTYWHDEFGKMRSHGCINLAAVDSAWLFEWTDPTVPEGWHSVINKERGTVVHVRP